jgi:hypothetical protein
MDLGVTVLTSLGGGHFNNLTRSTLDDDVAVLSQSRTLDGVSLRSSGIGGLEGVIVFVRHTIINFKKVSTICLEKQQQHPELTLKIYKDKRERKKKEKEKKKKPRDKISQFYTFFARGSGEG